MRKLVAGVAGLAALTIGVITPAPLASAAPPPSPVPLAFDQAQAIAMNGAVPDANQTRICGANDRRFLSELLGGDVLNYKVPFRLGDVVAGNTTPSVTLGKPMMISGVVDADVFGTGDFPFDHPGGSDFNMDVTLDPAFAPISQSAGLPSIQPMHTELSQYMVPHLPTAKTGPATGMTWEANAQMQRDDVQPGYFPTKGDRVIVQGRYVNDCGHLPFATELHPINFLAWSHAEGNKTVAQSYYAPYRETQTYNPDRTLANKVNQDRTNYFWTIPFPSGLINSILRIQNLGGLAPIDHLESWGMIEAVNTPPADWWVCAPTGTSGTQLDVKYDFVARPGVQISAAPDPASGCARMRTVPANNVAPEPVLRTCVLPWTWLSQVAADEAGVPSLDLKAQIKSFVGDPYKTRVDPDPIMDCYDPLKGPVVNPNPAAQNVTIDPNIAQPFYGRVEVSWSTPPPPSSTTSSSSTSSSSSSTTTTAAGQSLTVNPTSVPQGGPIEVSSSGWMPNTPVTFSLDDGTVLGTITTDRFGVATGSFTIPNATAVGARVVIASGTTAAGPAEVRQPITVTPAIALASTVPVTSTGSLPRTGASIAGYVAAASLLILGGLGIVILFGRRRGAGTTT